MSLITPADVNALNAGGGLSDASLQDIIDREEAEIIRRFGANYPGPITVTRPGGQKSIYLSRTIGTITSIVEYLFLGDTAPTTLTTTDYFVWTDQGRVERVMTGRKWGAYVTVVYTPQDDTNLRKQVLIEIVRIGANKRIAGTKTANGISITTTQSDQDWHAAREAQYARLAFIGV